MKALSIRQPWASLIIEGHKDTENRTWGTDWRGRFLVHASQRFDHAGYMWVESEIGLSLPAPSSYIAGAIIGSVNLDDIVGIADSPWAIGPLCWLLSDPRPCKPIPYKGRLGFYENNIHLHELERGE